MKFKKLLVLLLAVSFSFAFVACVNNGTTTDNPTTITTTEGSTTTTETTTETTTAVQSTTLSILNGWTDSGDSVYTITQDDTNLAVSYDKAGFSWANMSYAIDTDLSDYNKLVFAVSGEGTMMVKIQGATEAFEVSIQLTAGEVTYQLNLRDYDDFLGGVTEVVIFAAPGKANDTGNFTITKFEFDEGTAYGNVFENGDSNIPENQLEYDGTGETFDFAEGFIDSGDGIYTIDQSGDAPLVSYTKATGFEWAYMISTVVGDFSDFDYLVLELTGVSAGSVIFKAELSASVQAEVSGTFDADESITLCIDLTSWTDEQLDALTTILVFADGGSGTGSGSFTVDGAYFSKVAVGIEEPTEMYNFMTGFVDGGDSVYTVTENEADTVVAFTKAAGQSWSSLRNDFTAEAEDYNTLTFTVCGTVGESILVKPNDNGAFEQTITFDGNDQTIVVTADEFTSMIIFAMPGTESVSGSFTIKEAKLTYVVPNPLPASEVYDMQDDWVDNDGGIYTFTNNAGVVTVDYSKTSGQEWAYINNVFTEILSNMDTIELVVQGTIGEQLIIKPNNNNAFEQTVTFDGTEQTIVITVTETPMNLLIFVDPINGSTSGQFTILSAEVKASDPSMVNFMSDIAENDAGTYAVTEVAEGLQVDYTKAVAQEWAWVGATFAANDANTMVLTINGTSGESILIKPNDDGALEQTLTFDGTDQTVVITADSFTRLLMFVQPGSVGTGTFVIKEAKLCYIEPAYDFSTGFVDGGDSVYTVTENLDGTTTIDYTKAAGQSWSLVRNDFGAMAEGFNTMTLKVQGTDGLTILVKPNDSGALEQTITFDGTVQTFTFEAIEFTTIIMFAEAGTESVSGSFTIVEAKLSYVAPVVLTEYDFATGFVDGGDSVYTVTENVDGTTTIDYTKAAGQSWSLVRNDFNLSAAGFNTMTLKVQGTNGLTVLVKPNDSGALEQTITFDGTVQTFTFTADSFTTMIMFAEPGTESVSGSFTIVEAKLTYVEIIADDYDFVTGFVDGGDSVYTVTENVDGTTTIDYTKGAGQGWSLVRNDFTAEDVAGLNTITLQVQGTNGLSILLKPNDDGALEQTVTFDGTVQEIVISADAFSNFIIFAEPGTESVSGSFTIISAVVSHVDAD